MKLIGATASPYVRKVRIVMAEKKLDYQFVQENVWADDTHISTSNPLGKVPCLGMEGGEAAFDSRVILEYLDTLSPGGEVIAPQGRARRPRDRGERGPQVQEPGRGRQAVLQRHPPQSVRHRRGLRPRLAGIPIPRHRLAQRVPQPGQAARQADAAP